MASVKIDLGFGEHAVLSERAGAGISTAKHQMDAEEFLRRWPRTRSIEQERSYLRQLGLQGAYSPPGVNSSDASALLRAAVKNGKVTVVIERAATPTGGGVSGSGPTRPPFPLSERVKTARVAPARESYSYDEQPRYDDVSANDLIAYLEDFVSRTSGDAAAADAAPSMALADAQPFEYSEDAPQGDVQQDAGFFLTPDIEDECMQQHFVDMDDCSAMWSWGTRRWGLCKEQASTRLSRCLTGKGEID